MSCGHQQRLLNANLPVSVTSPDGTWTFAYDKQRRVIARGFPVIAGQPMTVSFGYDPAGNRLFVQAPDGSNDTMRYDAPDRPISATPSAANTASAVSYRQAP